MNKISENLKLEIVESEEYLRCKDDNIEVSCHLNPEGYAFILAKSTDKNQIANIEEILQL